MPILSQIDAATGEEESYASVLSRSIRMARSLRAFGLKPGDVVAFGGKNHLDVHIPFYASLFNGFPIVGVDPFYKYGNSKFKHYCIRKFTKIIILKACFKALSNIVVFQMKFVPCSI